VDGLFNGTIQSPDDPCGDEIWDKIGYYSADIRYIPEMFASNRGFSGSGY